MRYLFQRHLTIRCFLWDVPEIFTKWINPTSVPLMPKKVLFERKASTALTFMFRVIIFTLSYDCSLGWVPWRLVEGDVLDQRWLRKHLDLRWSHSFWPFLRLRNFCRGLIRLKPWKESRWRHVLQVSCGFSHLIHERLVVINVHWRERGCSKESELRIILLTSSLIGWRSERKPIRSQR